MLSNLNNLKISTRLGAGFAIIWLLLLLVAGGAYLRVGEINHEIEQTVGDRFPKAVQAHEVIEQSHTVARALRNMLLMEQAQDIETQRQTILEARQKARDLLQQLNSTIHSAEGKRLLTAINDTLGPYAAANNRVIELILANDHKEARRYLLEEVRPKEITFRKEVEQLISFQTRLMIDSGHEAEATAQTTHRQILLLTAVASVLSLFFAWNITRSVTTPLRQAVEAAGRIANGDLTQSLAHQGQDEVSELLAALARMQTELSHIVRALQDKSGDLNSAASDLAATAQQVSRATQEQAESAASMAASVEQMTVSIGQVAEYADDAERISGDSGQLTQSGSQVIANLVGEIREIASSNERASATMHSLSDSSNAISNVVSVIKEVADQTNLLALNAAIEAARAGEQGRGFAVVADEVRKLAERTTLSTEEIRQMIEKIQQDAEHALADIETRTAIVVRGVELAQQADASIARIRDGSDKVVHAVADIAVAIDEQRSSSSSIAGNVERIAQMSEENSAAVGQAADSARHLQNLAGDLRTLAGRFRT